MATSLMSGAAALAVVSPDATEHQMRIRWTG